MRLLPIGILFLAGCASLRSVSLTSIPKSRNTQVSASVSKWVVLGLNFDNDYVEGLTSQLQSKCDGKVTGILTRYQNISYFLFAKHEISASGYCLPKGKDLAVSAKDSFEDILR